MPWIRHALRSILSGQKDSARADLKPMTGAKPSLLRRMLGELQISSWTQVKNLEALHLHSNAACHPKHSSNAGRVLDRKDSSDASANCGNGRRTCCQLQDLNPKTIHCPRNMRLDGLICNQHEQSSRRQTARAFQAASASESPRKSIPLPWLRPITETPSNGSPG